MGQHRFEVMQRRQQLLAKISVQRGQMAELGKKWQTPLRLADQAWVAAGFLRAHSVLLAGFAGLVGLVVVRRRGVSVLVQGAVRVWKVYRYVDGLAKKMTSRP